MKERAKLFHRKFPDKTIAVTMLRKFYLKNKIRRKKVRQEKYLPPHIEANFRTRCQNLLAILNEAKSQHRTIVYLDEVNFTKLSFQNREWSGNNSNLTVDQKDIYTGYRSVIVAMTEESGIVKSSICPSAVNGKTFNIFLRSLRQKYGRTPLALFMDQL